MALPDVHVEIALGTDPLTRPADVDWTRIDTTCGLRGLSTSRGAGLRDGTIVTGSASATLDNRTGDLLPENTGGTWYPDLTLRKRIRFMKDGTDPLFTGFIDRLPVQWDKSGSDGLVELEAVDLLALAANYELAPSALHQAVMDLEPVAYWPLADAEGVFADDVAGVFDAEFARPVVTTEALYSHDDRPRPVLSAATGTVTVPSPLPASTTMTVSLWAACSTPSPSSPRLWYQVEDPEDPTGAVLAFSVSSAGAQVAIRDGSNFADATAFVFNPTRAHHYVIRIDDSLSTQKVSLWIDGAEAGWGIAGVGSTDDPFSGLDLSLLASALASPYTSFGMTGDESTVGEASVTLGDVAYFDSALTDDQIVDLYQAGRLAWSGDTTGARVERILDAIGVDPDDRDIDTGVYVCGPTKLGGNALEYLRKIAATERGALFVSADGKITFQQQYANDPTPLDVIGDSGCPVADITVDYSLDRMINIAEVTPETGTMHRYQDATAVAAFGPRVATRDTLHSSPSAAKSLAAELVVRNKDLRQQVIGLTLNGHDTGKVPTTVTVDTEIGDPYTVEYQPPGLGSAEQVLVRVESITHAMDGRSGTWTVAFDVDQQIVLPDSQLDTAGAGTDQSVLAS